jgi:hypothetical protein
MNGGLQLFAVRSKIGVLIPTIQDTSILGHTRGAPSTSPRFVEGHFHRSRADPTGQAVGFGPDVRCMGWPSGPWTIELLVEKKSGRSHAGFRSGGGVG